MADFNFLTGQQAQGFDPNAMPANASPWQAGPMVQAQNYPSITPGQQGTVANGLDWAKLGQWALNQPATQSGGYQQALAGLGALAQPTGQTPAALHAGHAGGPLGTVNQQAAGYIGPGMTPAVLPSNFLRAR